MIDRSAEIACCSHAILDGKGLEATTPFQAMVAYPERVAIGRGNYYAGLRSPALRRREIKPSAPKPKGPFDIIEADVDIVLRVVPILGDDVGPRAREIRYGHLAYAKIPILDAVSVSAHIQRI